MKSYAWLLHLLYFTSVVTAQAVIQSNTILYGNNPTGYDDGYIVLGGAYLAFQDMNTVPMYQKVRVQKGGALYYINNNLKGIEISSSHALFVDFVFENDGTIVVDDRKSTSVGVWKINDGSFTNTGDIMFTSSKGSKFDISAKSVTNTGFIYSKGTDANTPQILKIGNNADNWYNTGTICLANTTFNLKNPIEGVGCVTVGENSVFNIKDLDVSQQSIYLSDPTSVLAVSNGQNMPVSGFGNGNGFLFPDFPIKKFEYSYLTGILTFTTGYIGLLSFTIPVGKGYNDTLFEIVADNYIQGKHYKNNFFRYNGSPPNSAPSICRPCVEIPLYTFKVPEPYETTNDLGFSETISFYSTYNSDHLPEIGTSTIYTPPVVYTITKSNSKTTETDIISRVTGFDVNGSPITFYTTITEKQTQPTIITETITITNSDGSKTTITSIQSNNNTGITSESNTSTKWNNSTSVSSEINTDKVTSDITTVVTNSDGSSETDIISHITTTDSDGKPTTIVTTYPSPSDDGHDRTTVVTNSDGSVVTDIVSHITTTDSNGKPTTIVTTVPSPTGSVDTTVVTNSDGSSQTDIISHITTTDSNGKPTTVVTTAPCTVCSNNADYTTVVTKSNGSIETEVVSHITTTDSSGQVITITTTAPCTDHNGNADYTTVVTKSNGSVETEVVSHITTTDSNGKPTTVVTTAPCTVCSNNADYTTVVTKPNGSVETEVVSHITTTDSNGKPTTITTTVPCPDLESNVETATASPSMQTISSFGYQNGGSAKSVNSKPSPNSVTEIAVSQSTASNVGYSQLQGSSLEMFAPTAASAVESGHKVSQTQTASIFHGAGSTFKIKFDTILLSTSLTILILLGMA